MLLQEIRLPLPGEAIPLTLPLLRGGGRLDLDAPVTVIAVGNGSGKSALLEALAYACEPPVAGAGASVDADATLARIAPPGDAPRLSWTRRPRAGCSCAPRTSSGPSRRRSA